MHRSAEEDAPKRRNRWASPPERSDCMGLPRRGNAGSAQMDWQAGQGWLWCPSSLRARRSDGGGDGRERVGRGAGESRDAVGSVRRPDEDLGGSMDSVPGIFPLTDCRPSAVRISSFSSCIRTLFKRTQIHNAYVKPPHDLVAMLIAGNPSSTEESTENVSKRVPR